MERDDDRKRGRSPMLAISGAAMLLVVYILSYGPTLQLALAHDFTRTWKLFYAPFRWLLYRHPPLNDFMNWYASLWG